jgi:RNA polymerase sigma-70 factor, ECF subfamily
VTWITRREVRSGPLCVPVSRRQSTRLDLAGVDGGATDKDEALVRMLYREFGGALFGHVLYLTGNDRQWAEDVVQETLVRAWRNADRLDREPGMLRAWLFTVARRIVIDGRRSHSARPKEVDLAPLTVVPVPDRSEQSLSAMVVADALQSLRVFSAFHRVPSSPGCTTRFVRCVAR